jgi:hypothetical protein
LTRSTRRVLDFHVNDASGPPLTASLLALSGVPELPLRNKEGLGTPDNVLGRAGRKGALGRVTGAKKMPGVPQNLRGTRLEML